MRQRSVVTIGNFDGVHLGHREIVHRARAIADAEAARVVALAFDPHPATRLAPDDAPPALSSFAQRELWLRTAGVDEVVRLEPTPELLALSPEAFVQRVVDDLAPIAFVEGPDFHFGRGRAGSIETLRELGPGHAFDVHTIDPVSIALTDQTVVTASSTIARWLIANGRVRDASRVLGRHHELTGVVERGDQRGRTLGFPTANLSTTSMVPADGVYAALAYLPAGRMFPAAVHVGPRATFNDERSTVEAHAIGWIGPVPEGTPEYGWPLVIHLVAWLRGQAKFDGADALVEQIRLDVERACDILAAKTPRLPQEAGA